MPVGAEVVPSGGVHFRVWAPGRRKVEVALANAEERTGPGKGQLLRFIELRPEDGGYYSGHVSEARAGSLYKYRLDEAGSYPDPASRFQPQGIHGPSQVIDPDRFAWSDAAWEGADIHEQVIYEMHIGTFTREGMWRSAVQQLPALADLGVTVLEVMPVNEFPGRFGWGYDGVHPFAPTQLYGPPDDFRIFVDEAHRLGLAVILDVVYNHLGPDGNYFREFSPHYFTSRHETDWGEAINYYAEQCGPVREFFIANAGYWIREYHLDGLRLDATQNIYDESKDHVITALTREVRREAGGRSTIVVAENEPQDVRLIRDPDCGGYGLDAIWNDDLHHTAMVRLTGRNEAYYSDYTGSAQEFISSAKYGFLYQGQWYRWQAQRRGTATFGIAPSRFVTFIQNHDQVANSARGRRVQQLTSPGLLRAMTALILLGPGTPMLFQGQEFAAPEPFHFFADHKPEMAPLVREGRRKFMAQFRSLAQREMWPYFAPPEDPATFEACKLDHSGRESNAEVFLLHKDLLRVRRTEAAFRRQEYGAVDGAILASDAFVLRFTAEKVGDAASGGQAASGGEAASGGDAASGGEAAECLSGDRLLIVNFGNELHLSPAPEPLLAPPPDAEWDVLWSSEDPRYGGCGTPPLDTVENWRIPAQSAVALRPVKRTRTAFKIDSFRVLP